MFLVDLRQDFSLILDIGSQILFKCKRFVNFPHNVCCWIYAKCSTVRFMAVLGTHKVSFLLNVNT